MALTREQKSQMIADLTDVFKNHSVVVVADYTSLGANDMNDLRGQLEEEQQVFKVYKKSLINLALEKAGMASLSAEDLNGQVGLIYGEGEETAGARVVKQFAKKLKLDVLRSGVMEGSTLHQDQIVALADLPSRDQLRGMLVGTLAAPISGFARTLSEVPAGFVRVLKARADALQ